MLKALYLFGRRVGNKRIPVLLEERDEFCTSMSSSRGLSTLAEELVFIVERNFASDYKGPINIIQHAPVLDLVYTLPDYDTYILPEEQRASFQSLLPKKMQIEWVDKRNDEEFKKNLAFWQDYFKKTEPALVVKK